MVKKKAVKKAMRKLCKKIASGIVIVAVEGVAVFLWMWYGLQVATTLR